MLILTEALTMAALAARSLYLHSGRGMIWLNRLAAQLSFCAVQLFICMRLTGWLTP